MNDDYDNSKTDREMLNRLTGGTELPGDDTVAFSFPMTAPAAGELTALAQSAADLLQTRGHGGPFRVTVTVACLDGDPGCEPIPYQCAQCMRRTDENGRHLANDLVACPPTD